MIEIGDAVVRSLRGRVTTTPPKKISKDVSQGVGEVAERTLTAAKPTPSPAPAPEVATAAPSPQPAPAVLLPPPTATAPDPVQVAQPPVASATASDSAASPLVPAPAAATAAAPGVAAARKTDDPARVAETKEMAATAEEVPPPKAGYITRSDTPELRLEKFQALHEVYKPYCQFTPTPPQTVPAKEYAGSLAYLKAYIQSPKFLEHCRSARVYFNGEHINVRDAIQIICEREPVNMTMGRHYDETLLNKFFGHTIGPYNNTAARTRKENKPFAETPNTAAVFSETFLWRLAPRVEIEEFNKTAGRGKPPIRHGECIEIACLSLPAPPLDTEKQPHFNYYVAGGRLGSIRDNEETNQGPYRTEMKFLFNTILTAVSEHRRTAFAGKGIKRLVLSKFGQAAFIKGLKISNGKDNLKEQQRAHKIYQEEMRIFIEQIGKEFPDLPVVMSQYSPGNYWLGEENTITGNILNTAEEGDLIINAWDPHSAPGNGNKGDPSIDGWLGRATAILLTQTAWMNPYLRETARYVDTALTPTDVERKVKGERTATESVTAAAGSPPVRGAAAGGPEAGGLRR